MDDWIISPEEKVERERIGHRTKNRGVLAFRDYLVLLFFYPQETEIIGIEVGEPEESMVS